LLAGRANRQKPFRQRRNSLQQPVDYLVPAIVIPLRQPAQTKRYLMGSVMVVPSLNVTLVPAGA
jgi:hypothetical protein